MKKNGFTLIELLAVIVILAIIALIAVPIVLNIIRDARESSEERSVELYAKAVKNAIMKKKIEEPKAIITGSYASTTDGKNLTGPTTLNVEYDGEVYCAGIQVGNEENKNDYKLYLSGCTVSGSNNSYKYTDGTGAEKEGVVTATGSSKPEQNNPTPENPTPEEPGDPEGTIYSITANIPIKPSPTSIVKGESFYTCLEYISDQYDVFDIVVKMGGEDITKEAYFRPDSSECVYVVSIQNVTGNIEISAKREASISTSFENVEIDNTLTRISVGESYSATLTSTTSYGLDTVTVTMKGEDITSSVYNNGVITIPNVTGYVSIRAYAPKSQFGADSWSTVISNVKSGNTSKYSVGDTRKIILTSDNSWIAGTYTVRIANKSNDGEVCTQEKNSSGEIYSKTACGFVIEFVDVITSRQMNSEETNAGGWPASSMRTYVNNDIYNAFPTELKAEGVILSTTVVSGYGKNDSPNKVSTDKLYLLSLPEIYKYANSNDTAIHLTRQLDYHEENTVEYVGSGWTEIKTDSAIKKHTYGSPADWWLRTPNSSNTDGFYYVRGNGDWSFDEADYNHSIAPAFRIG